jgi:hypothetical protein
MCDMWWSPPSFTVIHRPEINYCIDPNNNWNMIGHIDSYSSHLPDLVEEVSIAHQKYKSTFITYPDYNSELFSLLLQEGYQSKRTHDIRYIQLKEHRLTTNPDIITKMVTTKEELILLEKTQCISFGVPFHPKEDSEYEFILQEYQRKRPRAIRLLALDKKTGNHLGGGGMSLFEDLDACLFFAGGTIPKYRNRGVYSSLISARINYARQRGISIAGVFARQETSSPITAKQGFLKCGEMTYWERLPIR